MEKELLKNVTVSEVEQHFDGETTIVSFYWDADDGRFGYGSLAYDSIDDDGYAYLEEYTEVGDEMEAHELWQDADRDYVGGVVMDLIRQASKLRTGFVII